MSEQALRAAPLFLSRSRLPVTASAATAVLVGAGASLMCVVSLGPMAQAIGPLSILVWAGTAFVGGLQCVLLGELASRFPERAGGTPQYAFRAWPRGSASLGALSAWCYWFAWTPGIAVNLILAADYLHRLVLPAVPALPIALVLGVLLYALAASGLRPVGAVGAVLCLVAVALLVLLLAAPIAHPEAVSGFPLHELVGGSGDEGGGPLPIAKWAFVASWSSYAAETATSVVAEIRQARRRMGQVMVISAGICLLACTAVPVVLFAVAPAQVAGDPLGAVVTVLHQFVGPAGAAVAGAGLVAVLLLGALAFIVSSSRTVYQLAEDGQLPRLFAHVNRRGAPTGSILLDAAVIATMLLVFGDDVVNVVAAANVGYLLVFVLLPLAYLALRRHAGEGPRLGRWAVPLAVGLLVFNLALLIVGGSQWGWPVMGVGLGISLLILPIAALTRRAARRASRSDRTGISR